MALWHTEDLDIDDEGNLVIKNTELGNAILRAKQAKADNLGAALEASTPALDAVFWIYMLDPLSPENKINVQCPC